MKRKTFIYTSVRMLLLTMAAALVLLLFKRGRISTDNSCDPDQVCSRCPDFAGCTRKKAIKMKGNEKG